MGSGVKNARSHGGGIISLVRLIDKHGRALEYDLMTRTGRTLAEYMNMGAAGKVALISFINYLPIESELNKELKPENAEYLQWRDPLKTNAILADFFDAFIAVHTKEGCQPAKYPRPNANDKKKIGKGAIPVSEFKNWFFGRKK